MSKKKDNGKPELPPLGRADIQKGTIAVRNASGDTVHVDIHTVDSIGAGSKPELNIIRIGSVAIEMAGSPERMAATFKEAGKEVPVIIPPGSETPPPPEPPPENELPGELGGPEDAPPYVPYS